MSVSQPFKRWRLTAVCQICRHQLTRSQSTAASGYSATSSSRPSEQEASNARAYCMELLRTADAPSYTLLAFIPPAAQTAYLAIRAFNVEVARIADTASTSEVATMRMAFWRDAVRRALDGAPPKQPVSILLARAAESLHRRSSSSSLSSSSSSSSPSGVTGNNGAGGSSSSSKLSVAWFNRVIAAREHNLGNRPYPTVDSLERYAENTYSTLLYLTLQALPTNSVTVDHVASHIGKATGIAAVLRGLPLLAFPPPPNHHSNDSGLGPDMSARRQRGRQGVVTLPLDVMAEAGVREEDVLRYGAEADGLRDAVFRVATRASDHLITARTMLQNLRKGQDVGHRFEHEGEDDHEHEVGAEGSISEQVQDIDRSFGVLMPAVSTQLWLDRLQKVDFDIFRDELRRKDWRLPWKAYFANRAKKF